MLAGAAAVLAATVPLSAFAQDATQPTDDTTQVDELIVTGSRIPRPNLEQPTPVATVTETMIENSGTSSLGDVLAELPALSSNGTVRANSDSGANLGGLSFPDLRDLGTSRTLTLVNGKRHVAGDAGDTAVDLNSIPTALVERVEVLTGGASAIYGSDAVTGVVNILLKDDFEGFEGNVQAGTPLNGHYGERYSAYLTGGKNFAGGRGNVTLTGFWDKQEQVNGLDIEGLAEWATIENPAESVPPDTNNGVPDRLWARWVMSDLYGPTGILMDLNYRPVTSFSPSGQPVALPPRIGDNNLFYGAFAHRCDLCLSSDALAFPVPETERKGLASTFKYDITPHLTFKGDIKYVMANTLDTFSPSFTFGEYGLDYYGAGNPYNNAFITPQLEQVLDAYFARPDASPFLVVNRINTDIGGRNSDTRRQTFRVVGELDGDFDAGFADVDWEASFNYGRTRNKFHSMHGLIPGNFLSAIDAVVNPDTGDIQCRRDVPATQYPGYDEFVRIPDDQLTNETCVPFNLFGQQNSQAAIDYVTYEADRKHTITQQVASVIGRFDTSRFLNLPGGPLSFAGGLEWRRETSRNINDPFVQSDITEEAAQPNAFGGFEVKEAFAEVEAPILKDAPFAYRLSLNGAVRVAEYSHAGDATAWKVGGVWAPISDLTFRGTYSVAVRAPNITEAFLPPTAGFFSVFDPCEAASINEDPNRAANCAALGVNFEDATDNQFPGVASGNTDLSPEEAKTWTAGFIYQPHFLPGLALTVDYYNIRIEDAITFLDPQDAADKCVDGPSLALQYCALIIRDPETAQIVSVKSSFLNQAALETAGWDIQLSYATDLANLWATAPGRLTFSMNANVIEKLRDYSFADYPDEVDIEEGEVGDPDFSFITSTAYTLGPLTVTWESQYMDRVRRNRDTALESNNQPYVEANWYHDLIGRYRFENVAKGTEVYVGINNITDELIPLGLTGQGTSSSYDIFGRYLFGGVKVRF